MTVLIVFIIILAYLIADTSPKASVALAAIAVVASVANVLI